MTTRAERHQPVRNHWARIALLGFVPVAVIVAIYGTRLSLGWILSAYGMISVGRCVTQSVMAARVRARKPLLRGYPMVSIVVTVLNERAELFERAVRSLAEQEWPAELREIIIIDDGSTDRETNREIAQRHGARYVWQPNAGKRAALMVAFGMLSPTSRYVLTGDSDTIWHPEATGQLVATLTSSRRVGAATGNVETLNVEDSWLTRVTSVRYWLAFEVERAAQSMYGGVTCVSGPLGGYRRDLIDRVKGGFIAQRFLGRTCTFGDDRHLTNLILGEGYEVHYSRARAWTEAPATFGKYRRQQARWGRSFWREMLWTLKALPRQSVLLAVDWAINLVLPFLLVGSMGWYAYLTVTSGPSALLRFAAMIMLMGLLRAAPAIAATRDPRFLILPLFALFHLFVLLPLKLWSLVTVAASGWGTRKALAPLDPVAVSA